MMDFKLVPMDMNCKGISNGHWKFPHQMGTGKHVGFIYVIRDLYMRKMYLGKKQYRGTGAVNKGVETNWRRYTSSSKELNILLANRPKDEFDFVCVEEYFTKGTLSYAETWSLCLVEAPTTDFWYNILIEKVSWNVKEPISSRHKERLDSIIKWGDF